jgi:hypothetical protein
VGFSFDLPSLSRFFIPLITGVLAAIVLGGSPSGTPITRRSTGNFRPLEDFGASRLPEILV